MMNPIITTLLASALIVSLGVAEPVTVEAKCSNNNTVCQRNMYVDADGDGICDNLNSNACNGKRNGKRFQYNCK